MSDTNFDCYLQHLGACAASALERQSTEEQFDCYLQHLGGGAATALGPQSTEVTMYCFLQYRTTCCNRPPPAVG